MKKLYTLLVLITITICAQAQQLPNAGFEDWSGAQYDGQIQPANWNASNVTQVGLKFNFAHREAGHTGSWCMMVQDQSVGAAGITEKAPGYFSLGQPWAYLPSITQVNQATAGTYGGINFVNRPDSMEVWIRRTGDDWSREDFYLLFYAWKGTAKGTSYKGKNGNCTSVSYTNEESDIRQALDGNECNTSQFATQICEGMWRERAEYQNWTKITVPIYYMNNEVPEMCNVIFSASNYPNFRANDGLYVGNSLYVDDVRLVYSSKIQHLFIGNKEWKGFDPNSTEEQVYSVGYGVTAIPEIYATRGEGSLTNAHGTTVAFAGRRLQDNEISITYGAVDGAATVITVSAEDGSSTTTYRIRFVSAPSNNAKLAGINVNGTPITGFNPLVTNYNVALPYGTAAAPVVEYTKAEDAQNVIVTQATSPTGTATIQVTAADGTTTQTYILQFSVAALSDNTLQGIKVNGEPIASFQPLQTIYKVELPLGTTEMPTIEAISAYPAGEQTIVYTAPAQIDGGQYQISVSTAGNPTPKVYKLNFKITASTNCRLQDLRCGDYISNFDPITTTYYVNLPIGTTALPAITYTAGDQYQTITKDESGVTGTDGTVRITVTAANGDQTIYKVVFTTERSSVSTLQNIFIGGEALADFDATRTTYNYVLPIGTTELPEITWAQGDEYQTVSLRTNGVNGTARITVTAGDGSVTLYQITFSVLKATNANLQMIYLDGAALTGFNPAVLEYSINLPEGTTALPSITYTAGDEWQTITTRGFTGLTGDYKITVRPQEGAAQTYILHFTQTLSANTDLSMIYLDGTELEGFAANVTEYSVTLPMGVSTLPSITYDKAEASQTVLALIDHTTATLRVTAASGASKVYTINFILQKSENALLQMIYLDGQPLAGFDPNVLTGYEVTIADACPTITVDKENGQQVIIMTPQGAGEAQIIVKPEMGESNTYRILFTQAVEADLLLNDIKVDGVSVADFASTTLNYTVHYTGAMPTVTYTKGNDNQEVTVLNKANEIQLIVAYAGETNTYTLSLVQDFSANCDLKSIAIDGYKLSNFVANKTTYSINLSAGEAYPVVTYELAEAGQSAVMGNTEAGKVNITVRAENGINTKTYTVNFKRAKYNNTTLIDLQLDGVTVTGFAPTTYDYTVNIEKGENLPALTYTAREGCHTVSANTARLEQKVLVIAESGAKAEYTITYREQQSNNALLSNILIEGVALENFASDRYSYTYALPRRTKTVPTVQPIAGNVGQTITVYFSRPDGTTRIHVVAEDGITEANYEIAFPMAKSNNTALESVYFEDLDFELQAGVYAYTITLPDGINTVPAMGYEKQEAEQRLAIDLRGVNETTTLTVTAEDGTEAVYTFDFQRTISDKFNGLYKIWLNTDQLIDLTYLTSQNEDNTEFVFTVPMPYGSKQFDISFEPYYAEQTIIAQPGGINRPTEITCKANRADETDVHYTIIPQVATERPARLLSLKVDNTPIEGFAWNKYAYLVNSSNVTTTPIVDYELPDDARVVVLTQNTKEWTARVTAQNDTAYYKIVYYYPAHVIPNAEFTEWESTRYNGGVKPTGWNTVADAVDKHSGFGTFNPKDLTTRNGDDIVKLRTLYSTPGGGKIPGFITLGKISGQWGIAGSSSFTISGNIPFRNSPDQMIVRYNQPNVYESNQIQYILNGALGSKTVEFLDSEKTSAYKELVLDLTEANQIAGAPTAINIILNSFKMIGGVTGTGNGGEMNVDWIHFVYNSALSQIAVNGETATREGNHFTYTLDNAEQVGIPDLTFTGEVSDQVAEVVWSAEENGVRNATIRNFAEDGTYTDYTLQVVRPLSTITYPKAIMLDNQELEGFTATSDAQTDYTVYLRHGYTRLPSLNILAETSLQTITVQGGEVSNFAYTITVVAENGDSKTYTIHFEEQNSSNATLATLTAEGVIYNPETTNYTITSAAMPDFTFTRHTDGQRATLIYPTDNKAVIQVIAEDGTENTYTFLHQPAAVTTSGLLNSILLEDMDIEGYNKNTFTYTHAEPLYSSFIREYETDSVIQTITSTGMTWRVLGTTENTYTLTYPTDLSTETNITNILVNGEQYTDFIAAQHDYELVTNAYHDLQIIGVEGQTMTLVYVDNALIVSVIAEDGTAGQDYSISILPELSANANLSMITLDGVNLSNFDPTTLTYTVTLPCANPKTAQPAMPSIGYTLGQENQVVTVETAGLDGTNYITVTSQDGSATQQYELTVLAEPSHNAQLSNIIINNEPVSHFEPNRHWYSAQANPATVTIGYATDDRYQIITQAVNAEGVHEIQVVAEDGVTIETYYVEIWEQALSNNAYLADIRLNGQTFSQFDATVANFQSKQLRYTLNLVQSTTTLPDVYAALGENGQTWELLQDAETYTIRVTAPDGITQNDYVLTFERVKSSNTNLQMIYVSGQPLTDFNPTTYTYNIDLPVGETSLPQVDVQKQEAVQIATTAWMRNTAIITVIAENNDRVTYELHFNFTQSDNCLLDMIYADGVALADFEANKYSYYYLLPVGTSAIPEIGYDEADQWQTVKIDTVNTSISSIYQIRVVAGSGMSRTYSVTFEMQKSDVNTLQMIMIDGQDLVGFYPNINDYYITLPYGTTDIPQIDYIAGDDYQEIDITDDEVQNGFITVRIFVDAENGARRIYTIYMQVEKSNNADLEMIAVGGVNIANFDAEIYTYNVSLPYGTETLPAVTFTKAEQEQNVVINYQSSTINLVVVAADGETENTYTINFSTLPSDNSHLLAILLEGVKLSEFEPLVTEYNITLPVGVEALPEISYLIGNEQQTVNITTEGMAVTIEVVAGNGDATEYVLHFSIAKSSVNTLEAILVNGELLTGFAINQNEYVLNYVAGSTSADFVAADAISYILTDERSTAIINAQTDGTIIITITAEDGSQNAYIIHQTILLDNNNYLADLRINGVTIANFDAEQTEYEYLLFEGAILPVVEAEAESQLADVDITMGQIGEITYIYCTAEDGTERIYTIYFKIADTQTGGIATANDVCIKQIPGTHSFACFSMRQNVQVALYDTYGHLIEMVNVPLCNPNAVTITTNTRGEEVIVDANTDDLTNAAVIELPQIGESYFYVFFQGGKTKLESGKLMLLR